MVPGGPAEPAPEEFLARAAGLDLWSMAAAAVPELETEFGAPRHIPAVCAFVAATVPAGRCAIYGAGSLALAIVEALAVRRDVEIVGFVDRRAGELPVFLDRPVVAPDGVHGLDADVFVLAHFSREPDMLAALLARGVPRRRIVTVFTDPRYTEEAVAAVLQGVPSSTPDGCGACVVSTLGKAWSIVGHDQLARVFPAGGTVNLFFGRPGPDFDSYRDDVFPVIDCHGSLRVLCALLGRMRPRVVYVKSSVHNDSDYLPLYIRHRFPGLVVISEGYDWSVLMSSRRLKAAYAYTDHTIARARLGNVFTCRYADLLVTKNGGARWDGMVAGVRAERVTMFPQLPEPSAATGGRADRDAGAPLRLLFAGSLPPPGPPGAPPPGHPDQCYIAYFDRLVREPGFLIDIFNAVHRSREYDATYAEYMERFGVPGAPIRYHGALRLPELLALMGGYDFGWHASHDADESTVEPVSRVGVGNKFTAYVGGGLPVVIDSRYEYMAGLVTGFGAGVVVDPDDPDSLPAALTTPDRNHLRDGVAALHRHMAARNEEALARIADVADGRRGAAGP